MTVLLFGATGRIGPHVARELVARGVSVAAMVRDPARAEAVLPPAVRLVPGDFADDTAVQRALDGTSSLLLLTPHGPDMAATQRRLVGWAAKTGTRVVKISGTSSAIRADGPDAGRQHWQAEQEVAGTGLGFVILRPNAFMQTLLPPIAGSVRTKGVVVNPLGSAAISLVDCVDIGAAAATALTDARHDGQTFALTGPAAVTYADIAGVIETVTGRRATVVETSPQAMAEMARGRGATDWEARHLAEMLALFRAGASEFVTDDVQRLTGRPPRSVADYVRDHAAEFSCV
jgi:uncharacterized protein YbjT (DUF2867 family)